MEKKTYLIDDFTGMVGEWFMFIHHESPLERATEPIENRVSFIRRTKIDSEVPIRLAALRPIDQSRIPPDLIVACDKLDLYDAREKRYTDLYYGSSDIRRAWYKGLMNRYGKKRL